MVTDLHTWILGEMVLPSIASVSFLTVSAVLKSVSFIQAALWSKRIPTVAQSEKQKTECIFHFLSKDRAGVQCGRKEGKGGGGNI